MKQIYNTITQNNASYYDTESLSAIEMTEVTRRKLNEVVEFVNGFNGDIYELKNGLLEITQNLDGKIMNQVGETLDKMNEDGSLENKINETVLKNKADKIDVEKLKKTRKLPQNLMYTPYWGQRGQGGWTKPIEDMKKDIDRHSDIGFDTIQTFLYILPNGNGVYNYCIDLDKYREGLLYAKNLGFNTSVLKLHMKEFCIDYKNANDTKKVVMENNLINLIDIAYSKFKDISDIFILNEPDMSLNLTTNIQLLVKGIEKINSLKWGSSICLCNPTNYVNMNLIYKTLQSHISVNYYPSYGCKKLNTTTDNIKGVLSQFSENFLNDSKDYNKKIIISEIGSTDNVDGFLIPYIGSYINDVKCGGKLQNILLTGLLEYFKNTNVCNIGWWYPIENDELFKDTIQKYTGGIKKTW